MKLIWDWRDWSLSYRWWGENEIHYLFSLRCAECRKFHLGCTEHWFCDLCTECIVRQHEEQLEVERLERLFKALDDECALHEPYFRQVSRRAKGKFMTEEEKFDTIVLCANDGYFEDDIKAVCSECGAEIVHRPHIPTPSRLICIGCFLRMYSSLPAEEQPKLTITEETRKEV